MKRLSFVLFCLFATSQAFAIDLDVRAEDESNYLTASYEYSQLSFIEGKIVGSGVRVGISHNLHNQWSFGGAIATAVNSSKGFSSSFTGLSVFTDFSWSGDPGSIKKTVSLDGTPLLVEKKPPANSFLTGPVLDQYLLNGSQQVYSVSGLGVSAKYRFEFYRQTWEARLQYSLMSANNVSIQGLFASIGISLPL